MTRSVRYAYFDASGSSAPSIAEHVRILGERCQPQWRPGRQTLEKALRRIIGTVEESTRFRIGYRATVTLAGLADANTVPSMYVRVLTSIPKPGSAETPIADTLPIGMGRQASP